MMYMNRIRLRRESTTKAAFWQQLRDIYAVHQLVWSWFATKQQASRDFLYRLESHDNLPQFYAIAGEAPHVDTEVWAVDSKPFAPVIRKGEHLEFVLRANPTRRKSKGEGSGKRHDVVMIRKLELRAKGEEVRTNADLVQTACADWFTAKGEQNGFEVSASQVRADGYQSHRVFKKGAAPIRFSTVELSGALTVTDPALFAGILTKGFGPAKGFGCGLMMVRRI